MPILVFIISFVVYVYTLPSTLLAGDSTEMVTAAVTLGIPHQPSYPLNTLLGHLFMKLPFGENVIWRVNLMSAFWGSLTLVNLYFIFLGLITYFKEDKILAETPKVKVGGIRVMLARREKEVKEPFGLVINLISASSALFLGFSLTFWQYSTRAEIFALNNFLVSLTVLLTLIFCRSRRLLFFLFLALVFGLALTHHQTSILIIPAGFYLIFQSQREVLFAKKYWFWGFALILVGLVFYYLSLTTLAGRNPALNWGNPTNPDAVLRALRRADYGTFSAYLVGNGEKNVLTPLDQIVFYGQSLIKEFTLLGVILVILGGVYLYLKSKRILTFLGLGLGMGVVFLAFANFPLADSFNQATTKRFQMLPDLFFVLFLAFGLYFLWQKFLDLKLDFKEGVNFFSALIVILVLSLVFSVPLISNFNRADNRDNNITLKYATSIYLETEPNAIIMLSGDVSNFVAKFVQNVIVGGDDRIVFTPGQFHLDWFSPQLESRYPDLVIPPPLTGKRWTSASQIAEANYDKRPIYVSPELVFHDPELEKKFVLWPKNLLFKLKKQGAEAKVEDYKEESQRVWDNITLSSFEKIRKNRPSMEEVIIGYYARYFHNLGYMYDSVKLYEDALREYKRALEIDPSMSDPWKNIGLIYGLKIEPRDYQQGVDFLARYMNMVESVNLDEADATRYTIQKIIYEARVAEASEAARRAREATESSTRVGSEK